jgi:hypothetical protein
MSHVIHRGGTALDHIALGVTDTREGAAYVSDLTGIAIPIVDPLPSQWFWSASVSLGHGRILEVIGPNPDVPPNNPIAQLLPKLVEPQILFWYVGIADLDGFVTDLQASGHSAMDLNEVTDQPPGYPTYKRGIIGPDYDFVRPMFIEWTHLPELTSGVDAEIEAFTIATPEPDELRNLFDHLGIDQDVARGPARALRLALRTPTGPVEFTGGWPPKTRASSSTPDG